MQVFLQKAGREKKKRGKRLNECNKKEQKILVTFFGVSKHFSLIKLGTSSIIYNEACMSTYWLILKGFMQIGTRWR